MLHPPNAPLPILPLPLLPTLHPSCQCSLLTMTIDNKIEAALPSPTNPSNDDLPTLPPLSSFERGEYLGGGSIGKGGAWQGSIDAGGGNTGRGEH